MHSSADITFIMCFYLLRYQMVFLSYSFSDSQTLLRFSAASFCEDCGSNSRKLIYTTSDVLAAVLRYSVHKINSILFDCSRSMVFCAFSWTLIYSASRRQNDLLIQLLNIRQDKSSCPILNVIIKKNLSKVKSPVQTNIRSKKIKNVSVFA